jgi:pyruvate,water dikinase
MKNEKRSFPSPFEVETPPGCEGWQEMYPYYFTFSEDRKELEEEKFWFFDSLHWPEPMTPFESMGPESCSLTLSQYNTRVFIVPPALGLSLRLINGYVYTSPGGVADPKEIEKRVPHFMKRAGHYFHNWKEVSDKWVTKVEDVIKEAEAIEFKDLPDMEEDEMVFEARGVASGHYLMGDYSKLLVLWDKAWNYHFELLNIMYAAYLTFLDFCKKAFPDIADQTVVKMVSGIDVALFRPDDELKNLAQLAIDLKIDDHFKQSMEPDEVISRLQQSEAGKKWVDELEKVKHPWFYMNTAPHPGFYHRYKSWIDDMSLPFRAIGGYIRRLKDGEMIKRPIEKLKEERDQIAEEYHNLLKTEEDKAHFKELLGLNKNVFPATENHLFYVDNWFQTVLFKKIEELGSVFEKRGFFEKAEDIFYLQRFEVHPALYDLVMSWATTIPGRGENYWPRVIKKRREMIEKFREWTPPPALGKPPETITDPIAITLYGINSKTIDQWLAVGERPEDLNVVEGHAGSPGVAEGIARVIQSPTELSQIETGEILVCPATSPSWAPIFSEIKALVADGGGLMSHGAIVCREYGLPAVVGTTIGTSVIKTGDRLKVDGNAGVVNISRD